MIPLDGSSKADKLLAALYSLAPDGCEVHLDDVAVRAWERDPEAFGLSTRPQEHPNVKWVEIALRPLLRKRWVAWCRPLYYRLTPEGRVVVEERQRKGAQTDALAEG